MRINILLPAKKCHLELSVTVTFKTICPFGKEEGSLTSIFTIFLMGCTSDLASTIVCLLVVIVTLYFLIPVLSVKVIFTGFIRFVNLPELIMIFGGILLKDGEK